MATFAADSASDGRDGTELLALTCQSPLTVKEEDEEEEEEEEDEDKGRKVRVAEVVSQQKALLHFNIYLSLALCVSAEEEAEGLVGV